MSSKKIYEFADIIAIKKREKELEEREEKERIKFFKVCSRCGEKKSIPNFSVDKRNTLKGGRTNICKVCKVIENQEYYYKNRDKILIRLKRYRDNHRGERKTYYRIYQEKNREKLSKLAKKWYQKNKKRIKKRNLKYYQENLEACLLRRKLWIEKNKEKIKKYNREYKRKHKVLKAVI
ncbi:hypothetical protein ES705_26020 [subsurface metagenome]